MSLQTPAGGYPLPKRQNLSRLGAMSLHNSYPAISDLKSRAKKRIPHFVWEYLDSATGLEATQSRNRMALDKVLFHPSILHGEFTPDISTTFLGKPYPLPIGIAPCRHVGPDLAAS